MFLRLIGVYEVTRMWVTDSVDVPDEILAAAKKGKLVIFVGAGASYDPPSNLPLFTGLAEKLANEQNVPGPTKEEERSLDQFLSRLPDTVNAHVRTVGIIKNSGGHCNSTHEAIVHLALASGHPRIVTTNYDLMLEDAYETLRGEKPKVYDNRALPRAGFFEGIVHLHGSILQPPTEIVLDAKDFGSAYLMDGYATKFLVSMFREYTVLFVGYSLSDPIMRYLMAAPDPEAQPKYMFVPSDFESDQIKDLVDRQIHSIRYLLQVSAPKHAELPRSLQAMADILQDDYSSHKEKMLELVRQGLPVKFKQASEVRHAIATEDGAKAVVKVLSSLPLEEQTQWVRWLLGEQLLGSLINKDEPSTPAERYMANWLTKLFCQRENQDLFIDILIGHHHIGNWIVRPCCQEIYRRLSAGDEWAVRTYAIMYGVRNKMAHRLPRPQSLSFEGVLKAGLPAPLMLNLMSLSLEFRLDPSRERYVFSLTEPSVDIQRDEHDEIESIPEDSILLSPRAVEFADMYLRQASSLYVSVGISNLNYFIRSAIEPHKRNAGYDYYDERLFHVCVNILRDYATRHPEEQDYLIGEWWNSGLILFCRLAIYLVGITDWSASAKIHWLTERRVLSEPQFGHEVHRALAAALSQSLKDDRDYLLGYLQMMVNDGEDHIAGTSAVFQLVDWCLRHLPQSIRWQEGEEFRRSLSQKYGYASTVDSDLVVPDVEASIYSPYSDELRQLILNRPQDFIALLKNPDNLTDYLPSSPYSKLTWQITDTVSRHKDVGIRIWTLITENVNQEDQVRPLLSAVIDGWALGAYRPDEDKAVAEFICTQLREAKQTRLSIPPRAASSYLHMISNYLKDLDEKERIQLDHLAQKLWCEKIEDQSYAIDGYAREGLYVETGSKLPGQIAWYWIRRIWFQHIDKDGVTVGFTAIEKERLLQLINVTGCPSVLTHAVFLFNASALERIDSRFTYAMLKVVLSTDSLEAIWSALLYKMPPTRKLVKRELFASFIDLCDEFEYLSRDLQRRALHFAAIMLNDYNLSRARRSRLLRGSIVDASHPDRVVNFMEAIAEGFLSVTDRRRLQIWRKWLHGFLEDRAQQIGGTRDEKERRWLATIVPRLGNDIREGITVLGELPEFDGDERKVLELLFSDTICFDSMDEQSKAVLADYYCRLLEKMPDWKRLEGLDAFLSRAQRHLSEEQFAKIKDVVRRKDLE